MDESKHKAILTAAAGDGTAVWTLPPELEARSVGGGDALAEVALSVMGVLVDGLSHEQRAEMGMVVGTTVGCLEMDREFDRSRREDGGRFASPAAFSRTLPSTVMAEMALAFGVKGPSLVVSAGDGSAAMALRRAVAWMDCFDLEFCVAGGMDWIGEEVQVGLVLLGQGEGRARMTVGHFVPGDLAPLRDTSLERIMEWVRGGREVEFGAGIRATGWK